MAAVHQTYMLDTNVFNDVLDRKISSASFAGCRLLVIGVQADELRTTPNAQKQENLLAVFEEINPKVTLASSFALDIEGAGFDQAYWNDGSGNFGQMLNRLQQLDRKNKNRNLNQLRDIGATLVSRDSNLRQVVSEFGGRAIPPFSLKSGSGGRTAELS